MIDAKTLLRITQIDMPPEALRQVLAVLADVQFAEEERKAKDRDRKRAGRVTGKSEENPQNFGHSNGNGAECPADNPAPSVPQRDIIKPPTNPSPSSLRSEAREAFRSAFEEFWSSYPNKVGKPVAERAFAKLWRDMNGFVQPISDGLRTYIATKPADRSWLNPSTFLNQRRFDDRPADVPLQRAKPPPASADGLDEARRIIRERRNGRDHNEDTRGSAAGEAGDRQAHGDHGQSPRSGRNDEDWRGPQLDLVAERTH